MVDSNNQICKYHSKIIGVNNNVPAYGNCKVCDHWKGDYNSVLKKSDYEFLKNNLIIGHKWQCVEYARRWLILSLGIYFESIPCAYNIFELKSVYNFKLDKEEKFVPYSNGSSIPPAYGDLIIFPKSKQDPWGHVAVCTGINLDNNYIDISEQNYAEFGEIWDKPDEYSRRIIIIQRDEQFILTDIRYSLENIEYIKSKKEISIFKKRIIGWMRVEFKI